MKPLTPQDPDKSPREMTEEETRELAAQLRKPHGEFGRLVADKMNEGNLYINNDTLDNLRLKEGHRILEVGMGNGHFVPELLSKHQELHYTGLDYSAEMVDMAKTNNAEYVRTGRARFIHGDITSLPFEEDHFDNVFTINTIYFWPSLDEGMRELSRVLKSSGQLIIAIRPAYFMKDYPVVKYNFKMYEGGDVARHMEAEGFTDIRLIFRTEPEQEVYGHLDKKESCLIIGKNR